MEAKVPQRLHWINSERVVTKPNYSLHFTPKYQEKQRLQRVNMTCQFQPTKAGCQQGRAVLKVVSCSSQNFQAPAVEVKPAPSDEAFILKNKSEEIEPYLDGRCIYLVGMMGSGKTTVGKILSESLDYSIFDCDKLIEQAVGGTTVAEIFKLYGESFFRDNETEVLRKLSLMHRLVISTGGGAVVRPINWKYMQKGISVWLDVPLEALARRITDVGTESRPLLHYDSGDAYERTLNRLYALWEERGEAYANASARVSLENIAAKLGYKDVCEISPTVIAIEALIQIENFLKK